VRKSNIWRLKKSRILQCPKCLRHYTKDKNEEGKCPPCGCYDADEPPKEDNKLYNFRANCKRKLDGNK